MSKFINGDCLKYMKEYPDNHFDLAIVDPPYGDGAAEWKRKDGSRFGGKFDKYRERVGRTGGKWAAKYGKKS